MFRRVTVWPWISRYNKPKQIPEETEGGGQEHKGETKKTDRSSHPVGRYDKRGKSSQGDNDHHGVGDEAGLHRGFSNDQTAHDAEGLPHRGWQSNSALPDQFHCQFQQERFQRGVKGTVSTLLFMGNTSSTGITSK